MIEGQGPDVTGSSTQRKGPHEHKFAEASWDPARTAPHFRVRLLSGELLQAKALRQILAAHMHRSPTNTTTFAIHRLTYFRAVPLFPAFLSSQALSKYSWQHLQGGNSRWRHAGRRQTVISLQHSTMKPTGCAPLWLHMFPARKFPAMTNRSSLHFKCTACVHFEDGKVLAAQYTPGGGAGSSHA